VNVERLQQACELGLSELVGRAIVLGPAPVQPHRLEIVHGDDEIGAACAGVIAGGLVVLLMARLPIDKHTAL
jgi:hypothetical protein